MRWWLQEQTFRRLGTPTGKMLRCVYLGLYYSRASYLWDAAMFRPTKAVLLP